MKITTFAAALMAMCMAQAGATTRIEFWTFSMKPKFTPFFASIERNYEAANPGVDVVWVDFPWDVIQTKLVTRIVAGNPPALVNLNVPWADEYARDGLLLPVDDLLAPAKDDFIPSTLDDLRFDGKVYGFPMYSNVAVVAYNREIFAQAGLTRAPVTLDEQLAFASQIATRTGKAGIAPALSKIDGFFMWQGLPVLKGGRAAFNTPAHAALVAKLAAAYKSGGLMKDSLFAEDNFPAVVDAYKGGRLGMLLAPPTALRRIEADSPAIHALTGVAPAPLGPSGIADGGWLIHFAIPRGVSPALLPQVGKFARYLTSDANQLAFARQASVFPATRKAANDPFFLGAGKAVSTGARSMVHSRTLYVAGVDDYDELRRMLVKAVEAGVTGRQDIAQALDEAARLWNRKLAAQGAPVKRPLHAWLFLAPALALMAAFAFWPVLYGSWLAFTNYSLFKPAQFVGLDNFRTIFANEMFVTGLKNSLLFLLIVPLIQAGALGLAVLVNNSLPGIRWFRAALYVPVVTTVSVVGIMWSFMLHEQGTLNAILTQLRIINAPVGWLSDDSLALFAIMFVTIWRGLGWYMVMYLAALQAVPRDLYEAATLDGASRWRQFRSITVPLLKPTIGLCTVLSVLAALKAYQEVDVLTQGGPLNSTFTALYYAYDQGLKHLKLPRALAASFVVAAICIAIAIACLRWVRKGEQ